jgi:hypothetical protein
MSAIMHGIIGGAVATALAGLSLAFQRDVAPGHDGWLRLRPNWLIHFAMAGCVIFVALISFFFLTGGSARSDAEDQNFYALLLMIAFGCGGLMMLWAGYLRRVDWRGETIRVRSPGRERRFQFADFVAVKEGMDGSELKFLTADGRVFRLSLYFYGAQHLLGELAKAFESRNSGSPSRPDR